MIKPGAPGRRTLYLVVTLCLAGVAFGIWQRVLPRSLQAERLAIAAGELALVTDIISNGKNGLIVTERRGRVLEVILSDPPQVRLLADLQSRVLDGGSEYGMYSVALSPNYKSNGWIYLSFSNIQGDLEVGRYRQDQDRYETILVVSQPRIGNPVVDSTHKGGQLEFRAGLLYVATGDGGTRHPPQDNPSHDPGSLLGKILRIDPEQADGLAYLVPPDNPFVGVPDARPEVWATGFRNPWKFTFDSMTGDLYISDVGDAGFEEINLVGAGHSGVDFGWNCTEGTTFYYDGAYCRGRDYTPPVHSYPSHGVIAGRTHCAVTGGEVIRSVYYPHFWGSYVYADICAARLYMLRYEDSEWRNSALFDFDSLQDDLVTAIGMHGGILFVANHKGTIYAMKLK